MQSTYELFGSLLGPALPKSPRETRVSLFLHVISGSLKRSRPPRAMRARPGYHQNPDE